MDTNRIVLDSVAFNMSAMVDQHNYDAIKIDKPVVEDFYVLKLTPITYTLQDRIQVNGDKITEGKLECDKKYMSHAQEH